MNDSTRRRLVTLAGGLILVSAAVHAVVGVNVTFDGVAGSGNGVAYGLLLLVGAVIPLLLIVAYRRGALAPIEAYAFGFGLMVLSLYAYVDVHAIGVLESLTGIDFHGQSHAHTGSENGHNGHEHDDGHAHSHDDGHAHSHGDDGHGHSHGDDGHGHSHGDGHAHSHDDGHGHDHTHDGSVLEVTADHLRGSLAAMIAKTAELCAALVLAGVALTDGRQK